ncbi:MAG TPA: Rrf2 family transcriptional regulator [Gemmatimonadales bacterium]|nr:Rrf2 family transcriptional regulator [Gemmatimonadales bacterium]
MLSQTAEYALRAVLAIAAQTNGDAMGAGELAAKLRIPQNYLSKTLHQLARAGVLESTRGKLGGFRLAAPAKRITLQQVVAPFDGITGRGECLLGRPVCSDHTACAVHERWKEVSELTARFFRETTIADISD